VIPDDDVAMLEKAGIAAIFTSGASLAAITDWVEANVPDRVWP
jgi:hypothetical protein